MLSKCEIQASQGVKGIRWIVLSLNPRLQGIFFKILKNRSRIHILTVELLLAIEVCEDPITMWLQ